MKRSRVFPAALLALLPACQPERPTVQDYYAILPDLVRVTEADARREAQGQPSQGPLFIDANSFAGGGFTLTRQTLNRDSLMAAIAYPGAVKATPQEAIVIRDTGEVAAPTGGDAASLAMQGGRWVREYGVLLHLNLAKWEPGEIVATVTSFTTDRRTWPTGVCRRVLRVTYRKQENGSWQRTGSEVRKRCDDPD